MDNSITRSKENSLMKINKSINVNHLGQADNLFTKMFKNNSNRVSLGEEDSFNQYQNLEMNLLTSQ